MSLNTVARFALIAAAGVSLSGCLAAMATGAVVGTAVGVTGAVVGAGVKGTGMVVGAILPGGDDKKDEKKKR